MVSDVNVELVICNSCQALLVVDFNVEIYIRYILQALLSFEEKVCGVLAVVAGEHRLHVPLHVQPLPVVQERQELANTADYYFSVGTVNVCMCIYIYIYIYVIRSM